MATKTKLALSIAAIMIVITVPYLIAGRAADANHVFGGFLVNPLDGNSYLAKMQQGFAGAWKFHLTYSPQDGNGAFIFLFYLLLGYIARVTTIPLIWMFHLARIIASVCLLLVMWSFSLWLVNGDERQAWKIFLLSSVGSGLGWLAAIFTGYISGDFWIAEAYPFLSMYTNPHFPLGLALVLEMCLLVFSRRSTTRFLLLPALSLCLAIIQPFGVVVLAIPLVGYFLVHRDRILSQDSLAGILALVPGGLYVIYQYFTIVNDPILSLWNAQNVTPAPAVWDLFISFSPAFLIAIIGCIYCWRTKNDRGYVIMFWALAGILLVYVPVNLQRRFLTGLYIPIAGLAGYGLVYLTNLYQRRRWIWSVVFGLSLITNLLLIIGGLGAAARQDEILYLNKNETVVLSWMRDNLNTHSVVLASPEMGTFIPAWSGLNVVYGHPFESVHAENARKEVDQFFSGQMDAASESNFLAENDIEYIFVGPRENALGKTQIPDDYGPVYQSDGVILYGMDR